MKFTGIVFPKKSDYFALEANQLLFFKTDPSPQHFTTLPPPFADKATTLILDRFLPPPPVTLVDPAVVAAAAATAADDDLGSADASLKTVDHSSAHSDSLHSHLDLEIACFSIK